MSTSANLAVELLRLLLVACPSYRQRREHPPASPAFDVTDFTHLCWDFAAHAADLVAAGRAAELGPVFAALAPFHDASSETWMKPGPKTILERLVDDCARRGAAIDAIAPFLTEAQRRLLDLIRDPDGHPYPIDGSW